jgi:hypothetical protein
MAASWVYNINYNTPRRHRPAQKVSVQPLACAGGKLTVSDGTHSATITVINSTALALHNFVIAGSDGNGGTLIDYHT